MWNAPDVCRRRWRFVAPAVLLLLAASVAADDRRPDPLEVSYRRALHAWASADAGAVPAYSDAQHAELEDAAGGPLRLAEVLRRSSDGQIHGLTMHRFDCVLSVETHTHRLLLRVNPELRLALAAFHLELHMDQVTRAFRPWAELQNRKRYEVLLDAYGRGSERDVRRIRALYDAWLTVGATQIRLGFRMPIERARVAFERARELDPEGLVARYWIAFAEEKLGGYDEATRVLQSLARDFPGSPEIRLRLARQLVRRGREAAAREELEGLLAGSGSPRVKVVAYEELAALLATRRHGWRSAVELLRRAIGEYPGNQRLRIQLSFLLADRALAENRRDAPPPAEVAALLGESEEQVLVLLGDDWIGTGERSPRLRYELPDATIVRPSLEAFAERIVRLKSRLAEAVEGLPRLDLAEKACDSGAWVHP